MANVLLNGNLYEIKNKDEIIKVLKEFEIIHDGYLANHYVDLITGEVQVMYDKLADYQIMLTNPQDVLNNLVKTYGMFVSFIGWIKASEESKGYLVQALQISVGNYNKKLQRFEDCKMTSRGYQLLESNSGAFRHKIKSIFA